MNIIGQDIRFKLRLSSNISKMLISLVCWITQIINLNRQIVSDLSELRLKEFKIIIDDLVTISLKFNIIWKRLIFVGILNDIYEI